MKLSVLLNRLMVVQTWEKHKKSRYQRWDWCWVCRERRKAVGYGTEKGLEAVYPLVCPWNFVSGGKTSAYMEPMTFVAAGDERG